MSHGFKRGSKWKTNNPAYLFLYLFNNSNEQLGDQPSHDNCIPCIAERYKVSGSSYENVNYVRLCDLYLQKRKEIESNLTRKKLHRTSQGSNFLVNSFTNRDNAIAPIQFRRERQCIFPSIAPVLLDWSNGTSSVFQALKSTSHFLPNSTVSCRSDSSSESISTCCHRSDTWSHLELRVASTA